MGNMLSMMKCRASLPTFLIALVLGLSAPGLLRATPLGVVEIKSVAVNYDSVKVDFAPVPGAKDYRIFEASNPRDAKYAGIWHLNPPYNWHFDVDSQGKPVLPPVAVRNGNGKPGVGHIDIPALEIEWNGLKPRIPTTLIVEAVDQVGPVPNANCTSRPAAGTIRGAMDTGGRYMIMPMYGSNAGLVNGADGQNAFATNGQGEPTNRPVAIARSRPFVVTATGHPTLPSRSDATQVFFDSFPNNEQEAIKRIGTVNAEQGREKFAMGRWTLEYVGADVLDSYPFVMNNHFMDVLFDGGTPGTNIPPHNNKTIMAMSPDQFADFSGGRILHLTMEVDAHTDARRWLGFNLSPADDPLQNWYVDNSHQSVNRRDEGFFVEVLGNIISSSFYDGRKPDGSIQSFFIAAAAGQGTYGGYRNENGYQFGRGLDDRSRFDLFISEKHFAVFEDGRKVYDYNLPKPLPFTKAKVYFTHYVYHTGNEINDLRRGAPYEKFWIDDMPWSDERHWDNMGFEVLPAAAGDWNALANLAQLPRTSAPQYVADRRDSQSNPRQARAR